jgi:hypothetical protein
VVPTVGCIAPLGSSGITWGGGALRGKGALDVGPSNHTVCLFTTDVTLDQTLGNQYHFIKPIHCIKDLTNSEVVTVYGILLYFY